MQLNVRKRKEYDPITEPENLDSESESDTVEITNLTRSFSLIKPKRIVSFKILTNTTNSLTSYFIII